MKGKKMFYRILLLVLISCSASAAILDEAKVYLPFEGEDTGIDSMPWQNMGAAGFGESPYEVGEEGVHTPAVTSQGLKGQAFDGSMMDHLSLENTYRWGEPNNPDPVDTALEQGLIGTYSFTVTFWMRVDIVQDQGRIVGTDNWQINYRGDFIEIHFIEEGEFTGNWIKSSTDPRGMPTLDHWRFASIQQTLCRLH